MVKWLSFYYLSKAWLYSATLAVTINFSFISLRFIEGLMVGGLSNVHLSFIAVEILEAALGLFLIIKSTQSFQYSSLQGH